MGAWKRPGSRDGSVLLPSSLILFSLLLIKQKKAFRSDRDAFLVFIQIQSRGIDAISKAGRLGTIIKDVSEVGVAAAALHFRPSHSVARIALPLHSFFAGRSIKTGPPRA